MDFDFLDRQFYKSSLDAIKSFQQHLENSEPPDKELEALCSNIKSYGHCDQLENDFQIGAVDGSGEFPVFQQDDIFIYLVNSAARLYKTETDRQHKLSRVLIDDEDFRRFLIIPGNAKSMRDEYKGYLKSLTGKTLQQVVDESDYVEVYSRFGKNITTKNVRWDKLTLPHASQISSHQYQILSMAEIGTALRLLDANPKYVLIDSSFVYFLLGNTLFLPEILKRYLKSKGLEKNICLIALSKTHNVPNGDLISRKARELGFKDHWYLRLPSRELDEKTPDFLEGREVPPKLCVSYLFKFHSTTFPLRVDLDARWWIQNINSDVEAEKNLFRDLDYCCHDVRSYGYPYPIHAAHRSASLTKGERKAIRDILKKHAMKEGLIRDPFERDGEDLHMGGI
jgi:hypothetical protein